MDNRPARPKWDEDTYALARKIMDGSKFGFIAEQDREDILQDFALKNPTLERFQGKSKLSTWLHSCLYNIACSFARDKEQLRKKEENRITLVDINKPKHVERADSLQKTTHPELSELGHHFALVAIDTPWRCSEEKAARRNELHHIDAHLRDCRRCAAIYSTFQEDLDKFREYYVSLFIKRLGDWDPQLDDLSDEEVLETSMDIHAQDPRTQELMRTIAREIRESSAKDIQFFQRLFQFLQPQYGIEASSSPEMKRQRVCGNCGASGHNRRTCRKEKDETKS